MMMRAFSRATGPAGSGTRSRRRRPRRHPPVAPTGGSSTGAAAAGSSRHNRRYARPGGGWGRGDSAGGREHADSPIYHDGEDDAADDDEDADKDEDIDEAHKKDDGCTRGANDDDEDGDNHFGLRHDESPARDGQDLDNFDDDFNSDDVFSGDDDDNYDNGNNNPIVERPPSQQEWGESGNEYSDEDSLIPIDEVSHQGDEYPLNDDDGVNYDGDCDDRESAYSNHHQGSQFPFSLLSAEIQTQVMLYATPEQLVSLAVLSRKLYVSCSFALLEQAGLARNFAMPFQLTPRSAFLLAWDVGCQHCGRPRIHKVIWALRIRACEACIKAGTVRSYKAISDARVPPRALVGALPQMTVAGYNRSRREQVHYGLLRKDDFRRWLEQLSPHQFPRHRKLTNAASAALSAVLATLVAERTALDETIATFVRLAANAPRPRTTHADKLARVREAERLFRRLWPPLLEGHADEAIAVGVPFAQLRYDILNHAWRPTLYRVRAAVAAAAAPLASQARLTSARAAVAEALLARGYAGTDELVETLPAMVQLLKRCEQPPRGYGPDKMAVDAKTVADAAVRLAAVMAGVPQGAERKSKAYRDALAAITNTAENRMSLKQGPPVDKLSRKALVSRSIGDSRKNSSRFKGPAEFYLATRDIAPDIVWTMIHEAESAVAALQRDKMGFIPEREMTQVKLEPRVVVGRNVGEGIDKGKGKAGQEPLNIKQESESPAFSANDEGKRGGNPADQLSAVSVSSSSTRLTAVDADFLRKLMTTYPFNIHKSKAPLWLRSTPTYKSIQAAVKGKTAEAAVKDRLPELVATMVEEVCRMPRWTQSMNELSRKCSCGGTASASCDNGKCGRCCRPPCKNHLRPK